MKERIRMFDISGRRENIFFRNDSKDYRRRSSVRVRIVDTVSVQAIIKTPFFCPTVVRTVLAWGLP